MKKLKPFSTFRCLSLSCQCWRRIQLYCRLGLYKAPTWDIIQHCCIKSMLKNIRKFLLFFHPRSIFLAQMQHRDVSSVVANVKLTSKLIFLYWDGTEAFVTAQKKEKERGKMEVAASTRTFSLMQLRLCQRTYGGQIGNRHLLMWDHVNDSVWESNTWRSSLLQGQT